MKILENIIEKVIGNKLKKIDFDTLIENFIEEHKDEIQKAIVKMVSEAVSDLIEKMQAQQ